MWPENSLFTNITSWYKLCDLKIHSSLGILHLSIAISLRCWKYIRIWNASSFFLFPMLIPTVSRMQKSELPMFELKKEHSIFIQKSVFFFSTNFHDTSLKKLYNLFSSCRRKLWCVFFFLKIKNEKQFWCFFPS